MKEKNIRDLAIGETFYFKGHKLKVVEVRNASCNGCFILKNKGDKGCNAFTKDNLIPECLNRKDGKLVIFVKE